MRVKKLLALSVFGLLAASCSSLSGNSSSSTNSSTPSETSQESSQNSQGEKSVEPSIASSEEESKAKYTITFVDRDNVVSTQQVEEGDFATIPQDPTNEDARMIFKGWSGIDSSDYEAGKVEVFGEATYTAVWEEMFGTNNVYNFVKVRTAYSDIEVDGKLDKAYKDAKVATASTITVGADRGTTADLYAMFDDTFFYMFVDVKDNTPYYRNDKTHGAMDGRWTEFDDAIEIRMDIMHNTHLASPNWNGGWGGDYRGGNMCEAGFKVAAGCSLGSTYQDGVGAELFWDYWWSNAARTDGKTQMISTINDTGYTVEIKIDCEDVCISGDCKPAIGNEIGLGLKVYDQAEGQEQSIVCLESINDDMASSPKRVSNFKLIENEHENDVIETHSVSFMDGQTVLGTVSGEPGDVLPIIEDPLRDDAERLAFAGWDGLDEEELAGGYVVIGAADRQINATWKPAFGTNTKFSAIQKRASTGITVDGILDTAYGDVTPVNASTVTAGANRGTNADIYTMFDDSYLYIFLDVKDSTPRYRNDVTGGEVDGRWTETDDAVELRVDLLHSEKYASENWNDGWGGDYRGDKMVEAGLKIAAGCDLKASYTDGVGAELFWDYWWTNACRGDNKTKMVSVINDNGYTVEIALDVTKGDIPADCKPSVGMEFGMAVKIYDKADDQDQSLVCLESINDDMGKPRNCSTFRCLENDIVDAPTEGTIKFLNGTEVVYETTEDVGNFVQIPANPTNDDPRMEFDHWDGLTAEEVTAGQVEVNGDTNYTAVFKEMFGSPTKYSGTRVADNTIVVDGAKDAAYGNATAATASTVTAGANRGTAADISLMYDESFLYVFVDVKDNTPRYRNDVTGGEIDGRWTETDDAIEMRIDLLHSDKYASENWNGGWGGDYRNDKMVEAGLKIAAGCDLKTAYADGVGAELFWDYWWANACRSDNKSKMVSTINDNGYTVEIALDVTKGEIPTDCKPTEELEIGVGFKLYDKADGQDQSIVCLESINDSMHIGPKKASTFVLA